MNGRRISKREANQGNGDLAVVDHSTPAEHGARYASTQPLHLTLMSSTQSSGEVGSSESNQENGHHETVSVVLENGNGKLEDEHDDDDEGDEDGAVEVNGAGGECYRSSSLASYLISRMKNRRRRRKRRSQRRRRLA